MEDKVRYRCLRACFVGRRLREVGEEDIFLPASEETNPDILERIDDKGNVVGDVALPEDPPAEVPKEDVTKWKRPELLRALNSKGIKYNPRAKNVELIALLNGKMKE